MTHEGREGGAFAVATYSNRKMRVLRASGCGAMAAFSALLLVQMARRPTGVVEVYMAVVSLFAITMLVGAYRSLRVGIVLDDVGVRVHNTYSTKTWRYEELTAAGIRQRPSHRSALVGLSPMRTIETRYQLLPMLRLTTGKIVQLYGFRMVIPSPDSINWVSTALEEANARIVARRRATGSSRSDP